MIDYALRRLTRTQEKVLVFVDDYIREHGYPPTRREICTHLGSSSTHGAHGHMRQLELKGMVQMLPRRGRTLQLTEKGKDEASYLRAEAKDPFR